MPKLKRARIRPFTGEIYFTKPLADDDPERDIALRGIGLGDIQPSDNGNDVPVIDVNHLARDGVLNNVLRGPTVHALVDNAYDGPVLNNAGIFPPPTVHATVSSTTYRQLVGHPIMVYKIPQIVQVTYPASSAFGGLFLDNYPINRTDFRMVRGVQNEINFYVRDVDRKPVPLGMSETLTIHIVDLATNTLLMSRNLTIIDSSQGIYVLTVYAGEMDTWPTTPARWSLCYNRADGSTVLLWTDRAYSPYSTCTITEGPIPGPAQTVATQFGVLTDFSGVLYSPAFVGAFTNGFVLGAHTFLLTMNGFTGDIRIDVSLATAPVNDDVSTDWIQFDFQSYVAKTGDVVLTEVGNFLWARVVVFPTSGSVDQIKYKA